MIFSYLSVLIMAACVDRIDFGVEYQDESDFPIVVDGFISDENPPYSIKVTTAFDIDSKRITKTFASVKQMKIIDEDGNEEQLVEVEKGRYLSHEHGLKGVTGKTYRLWIELNNGAVFESEPDVMPPRTFLDSIHYVFTNTYAVDPVDGQNKYAFDFYFDDQGEVEKYLLWKFAATFKVISNPDMDFKSQPCEQVDCLGCSFCNLVLKCSGYRNYGKIPTEPEFRWFEPCSCCICWYSIFNDAPVLSDVVFTKYAGQRGIKIGSVPVHKWVFQNKVYATVSQFTVSSDTYRFYKSIRDQKEAINSLFQPITGKIPTNFKQVSGPASNMAGFFYSAAVDSKTVVLTKDDVPPGKYSFPEPQPIPKSCRDLFPNSTTIQPSFWKD